MSISDDPTNGNETDDFETFETATYRRHYESGGINTSPDVTYDQARIGYQLGHRAASNPTYNTRNFEDVEVDLRGEYPEPERYEAVRPYARHAFEWKKAIGGIALAGGAFWAGKKLLDAVRDADEKDLRTYYESHPRRTELDYDRARTGYMLGYAAARNPEYSGRQYTDVESDLRAGFAGGNTGSYDSLKDFAERGYERGSGRTD